MFHSVEWCLHQVHEPYFIWKPLLNEYSVYDVTKARLCTLLDYQYSVFQIVWYQPWWKLNNHSACFQVAPKSWSCITSCFSVLQFLINHVTNSFPVAFFIQADGEGYDNRLSLDRDQFCEALGLILNKGTREEVTDLPSSHLWLNHGLQCNFGFSEP